MTREIIYNLLNMNLSYGQQQIVNGILAGKQDLEELKAIDIDEQVEAIKSMFAKQIYILSDDLIKPALNIIESDVTENFLVALQGYLEVEDNIHNEYDDREVFIKIAKRNPNKIAKWIEVLKAEDLIS